MFTRGTSSWRSCLGCHGLCCVATEDATAPARKSEDIALRAIAIPQGRTSASLPPGQVSRTTEPINNTALVSSSQPQDGPALQPGISSQINSIDPRASPNYQALREQQEELQQLWKEAFAKFEASQDGVKLREVLVNQETTNMGDSKVELAELLNTLEGQMKRVGVRGKLADAIGQIVPHLNRFAIVGDVAVSSNPNPAALPWAAVRFVLLNITAGEDIRAKIFEGIAEILILIFECCVYQELHLTTKTSIRLSAAERLRNGIIEALSQCIRFLAFALCRQKAGAKALTDAFRVGDFSGYLKDLHNIKVQLHDAGLSCEMYQNSQSRQLLKDLHNLMIDTREGSIQRLEQEAKSKLKNLLLDPKDAFDHMQHPEDSFCLPGTRQKVLQEIYDWNENPESPRICWLPGLAGTGKSTISRTVARDLKGQNLGGCFFFKKGAGNRAGGRSIFPIIAYQLALNIPPVRQHIIDAVQEDPSSVMCSMNEQWRTLIREPLNKVQDKEFLRNVVLVIDALDECDEGDRGTIMNLFASCSDVLKIFVTSRPELKIQAHFARQQKLHREIALHRVKLDNIKSDITTFLKYHISIILSNHNVCFSEKYLHVEEDWPGSDRFRILVERSIPLFIAAATFIRMIGDTDWAGSLDSKLDFIIENSNNVSSAYEGIYKPVLNHISNGPPHEARVKTHNRFIDIIGSFVLLASPLSITSLAVLLGVKVHDVVGLVNPLRSVIEIPRDESPIKLFHLSFRDFLLSESAERLQVDEALTHAALASRCLKHLERELKTDICGLGSPGKSRVHVDPCIIDLNITPETRYACLHWVHHLIGSGSQVQDNGEEHQFLKRRFLNWLEVLCWMGRVFTSFDILQSLIDISKGTEILRFVQESIQFVSFFRAGIDKTPLQLYHSGMIFSPSSSIVPQPLEERHCPNSVTRLPTVDSDWPHSLQAFEVGDHDFGLQLAFLSNDRVISWGFISEAKIWSTTSGNCLQTLNHDMGLIPFDDSNIHTEPPTIGLFCEESMLAMGMHGRVDIWNVDSYSLIYSFILKNRVVINVAFSDDGTLLCSISKDSANLHGSPGLFMIHNLDTGECMSEVQIRSDYNASCLSTRGQWLACVADESVFLSTWTSLNLLEWDDLGSQHNTSMRWQPKIQFSPDGSLLAMTTHDECFKIWRTGTKQCTWTLRGPWIINRFSLTQEWLAVSSKNRAVFIVDLKTGLVSHEMGKIATGNLVISPNAKSLATVSKGDTIRVWDLFSNQPSYVENTHPNPVEFLTMTSDEGTVVSACEDQVKAWDVSSGLCIRTFKDPDSIMMFRIATEDGSFFAVKTEIGIEVWSLNPMRQIQLLQMKEGTNIRDLDPRAISRNGMLLAFSSFHNEHDMIELWDVDSGLLLHNWTYSPPIYNKIVFSPDGLQVAYTTDDAIEIRQTSGPYNLLTRIEHVSRYPYKSLEFHRHKLVAISTEGDVKAWDTKTGELSSWCRTRRRGLAKSFINHEVLLRHVGPDGKWRKDILKELQVSADRKWITRSGERIIWLPLDYRPTEDCPTYTSGSIIVIGNRSGRVLILHMAE